MIEPSQLWLENYVDAAEEEMKKAIKGCKTLERSSFKTSAGAKGIRVVHEFSLSGKTVRSTFYAFDAAGDNKHVFTTTVVASRSAELAPVFDNIIRTYKP